MRNMLIKCRASKIKTLVLGMLFLTTYLFMCFTFLEVWFIRSKQYLSTSVQLQNVIVHIDLKGTPLKITYLESLLPLMKKHGVNGLLMEYEDMFPYEGKLVNLSAEYCYSKTELKNFLTKAKYLGFEIIPLVQTFGHLEYALKLDEFKHLREVAQYPDAICPSKLESQKFLGEMIKQIIDFHTAVSPLKFLHIGCDEVFHFNECRMCTNRGMPHLGLFLKHIKFLENVVNNLSEETTVLIWDDMLRHIKPTQWRNIAVFENVHPVCWDYGTDVQITHEDLYKYHKKFPHIWIATAFKGADGRTATLPNLRNRFLNHFNYLKFILGYKFGGDRELYKFEGIILTGWSRYSHMEPPCELLPVSIPSLVVNLLVIQKFKSGISDIRVYGNEDDVINDMFKKYINVELNKSYNSLISIDNFEFSMCKLRFGVNQRMKFNEELYNHVRFYSLINAELLLSLNEDENFIAAYEYYSRLGMVNMNTVIQVKKKLQLKMIEAKQVKDLIVSEMTKYYHNDFIMEYVNYKGYLTKTLLVKLINSLDIYQAQVRTWKRRMCATNVSLYEISDNKL